jgi:hypothetical protein
MLRCRRFRGSGFQYQKSFLSFLPPPVSTIATLGRTSRMGNLSLRPRPQSGASLYLKAVRSVRVSEKIMPTSNVTRFSRPHCAALYQLVHVEAEAPQVTARSPACGATVRCHVVRATSSASTLRFLPPVWSASRPAERNSLPYVTAACDQWAHPQCGKNLDFDKVHYSAGTND